MLSFVDKLKLAAVIPQIYQPTTLLSRWYSRIGSTYPAVVRVVWWHWVVRCKGHHRIWLACVHRPVDAPAVPMPQPGVRLQCTEASKRG